ncbi:dTDP-4-dehydrorhamnose 3,5-epimerase [Robiginitalea marina]|uniref:dTDP-4-dehydrorhamnose 3,5-epimerase n=1 Tax=Robiginitalea marina TaxID=2954105 RepID=A0ABT1AWC6_9FLAO|nr:dTDP-4-dehydrorhamnose 3,5-epimerase [Robiginitalea marina]MCO5724224.1 dTDP-4-dehydrorhamnose 3,5-epimerase [Robiginitalea marina]
MKFEKTGLEGCFIIEPTVFEDNRGYFMETFSQREFEANIGRVNFVQDNQSHSKRGVVRALHYQVGDAAQAKLVRVLQGRVLDVAVDLRKDSLTFGEHIAVELSETNKKQIFIPRGFAHGFVALSETAEFFYKCDNFYDKNAEAGIIYSDPDLKIDWVLSESDITLSLKDAALPLLKNARLS